MLMLGPSDTFCSFAQQQISSVLRSAGVFIVVKIVIELRHGNAPLIPFTLAWLIGIWIASRMAVPSAALGIGSGMALIGVIIWRRALKPRWVFILALAAILGALRYNLTLIRPPSPRTTTSKGL
jgi:hypothetical protein